MATMKEIAKACGVSVATVSNILNNQGKATEKTREQVLRKADELHYVPNFMAKNLKQKENKNIGIITEDLTIFHAPAVVDGITACLEEQGYNFLLGNIRLFQKHGDDYYRADDYERYVSNELKMMLSKQVAGIIYVQGHCHEMNLAGNLPVPAVMAYGMSTSPKIPHVIYDDRQGAYDAVRQMLRQGHVCLGVITGPKASYHTRQRLLGYQKALFDHKILYNPGLAADGDWTRESGYEAAEKLVKNKVTAIFAMNDLMAGGVYDYARKHQLTIGKDLSVVGFDNREICQAFYPELSSVKLPLFQIGYQSAKLLLKMLGQKTQKTEECLIPCEYIERESNKRMSLIEG